MTDIAPGDEAAPVRPGRPRTVDYAVYALIARCMFSIGSALALYGARDDVRRSLAEANKSKNWSSETLEHNLDSLLRGNLITTLVMVVLVGILIRFLRDGRNWARLLYLIFAVLITRDLLQVLGFFQYDDFAERTLTGLTGLAALAAVVLLFLPPSNAFFRPVRTAASPFGGLFGARPNARLRPPAGRPGGAPGVGDPAVDVPAVGDPAANISAVGDPAANVSAVGDPAVGDPAGGASMESAGDAPVEPATVRSGDAGRRPRSKSRRVDEPGQERW